MKKYIIIVISFLIVMICVFITGFFINDLLKNNSFKDKIIEKNDLEEKQSKSASSTSSENNEEKMSESEKIIKDIKEYYLRDFGSYIVDGIDKIPSDKLVEMAVSSMMNEKKDNKVSKEEVSSYIKRYFGPNMKHIDQTIICTIDKDPLYEYKDGYYTFYRNKTEHGHGMTNRHELRYSNYVNIISYEKNSNEIIVNAKILYSSICNSSCGPSLEYYKLPKDKESIIKVSQNNNFEITEEDYKSIENKLPTTTFIFKQNDDGTYFLASTKVKD